jgi:hypothetical protein
VKNREDLDALAQAWVDAFEGDEAALARLNGHYERQHSIGDLHGEVWGRVYAYRQRSGLPEKNTLRLEEAQLLLAQDAGYGNWESFAAAGGASAGPIFDLNLEEGRIAPRRRLRMEEWRRLVDAAREHQVRTLVGHGQVSDGVIGLLREVPSLRRLELGGSRELSDAGLRELRWLPQIVELELSEYPGGKITDAGLEVLGELRELRRFEMTWQRGVSDAGLAHLQRCEKLERVNVMGSLSGDGLVEALRGKVHLRELQAGAQLTDARLRAMRDLPALRAVLLDGRITDAGIASLAGWRGVEEVDVFWHANEVTAFGIAAMEGLPDLEVLGCDGRLADNTALAAMGGFGKLKRLRIQEAVATDVGFAALARSESLEAIWGRVCEGFGDVGFAAFAQMPRLARMGIGLGNVSEAVLERLPEFPALRELTPIGLGDEGFRNVGQCRLIERLTCMYCSETTDVATEWIRELPLRYYYAGLTKITDRSLEILGGMATLEQVDLYECNGLTDAGLRALAGLPRLCEVNLDALLGVTLAGTRVFGAGVRVRHSN